MLPWPFSIHFLFFFLLFTGIFVLFIPIEFLSVFRIYNASFKDLIFNIIYSILISLFFLVVFQFSINPDTLILSDISSIGKAVSFAGFVSIPIILFIQHIFRSSLKVIDKISYSFTLFVWIFSSQVFL